MRARLLSLQVDLVGGYYDAGDNIKFGFPMAFTVTILSWGALENADSLVAYKELDNVRDAIRWGTDYLLKATVDVPLRMWVQVTMLNTLWTLYCELWATLTHVIYLNTHPS